MYNRECLYTTHLMKGTNFSFLRRGKLSGGGSKIKLSVKINVRLVKSLCLYSRTVAPCNLRVSWVLSAASVAG